MSGLRREVPGMSRADVAIRATLLRQQWALLHGSCPDAFPVTEYIELVLPRLKPEFTLEVVEDEEMGEVEGATWPDQLRMRFGNSVYEGAARGERRHRFTVAHELGHLFLHGKLPFARLVTSGSLDPFRCSEWQADEFAAQLLMPSDLITSMRSMDEISNRCQVSMPAVRTRLGKLKITKPLC